jgi:hypothetical protein
MTNEFLMGDKTKYYSQLNYNETTITDLQKGIAFVYCFNSNQDFRSNSILNGREAFHAFHASLPFKNTNN